VDAIPNLTHGARGNRIVRDDDVSASCSDA